MLIGPRPLGVDAVGGHGPLVGRQLIGLPALGCIVAGEEVSPHVIVVLLGILELGAQLLRIGEVLAVHGVGHAVLLTAAEQIRFPVPVDVAEGRGAEVAELQVVVALIVPLPHADIGRVAKVPLRVPQKHRHIALVHA